MNSRRMSEWFVEAYEDFAKTQRKCGACYKVIWILLLVCILLVAGGVTAYLYWNQTAGLILLSIGISMGVVLCFGAIGVCIGWCLRPESVLPVSVGR